MLLTKLKTAAACLLVIAALGVGASAFGSLLMTGRACSGRVMEPRKIDLVVGAFVVDIAGAEPTYVVRPDGSVLPGSESTASAHKDSSGTWDVLPFPRE